MDSILIQEVEGMDAESERLVSEILRIMEMIKHVKKRMVENQYAYVDKERLETLLRTLRLEMVKRSIMLTNKYCKEFKPYVSTLFNGGVREETNSQNMVSDFFRLEEELNRAYHVAKETLTNLSRLL
ncbi:MAG: hypothetical protein ACUVQ0_00030 [Thermoproteota archaeon]